MREAKAEPLSARLQRLREARGLSTRALSRAAGLSASLVSHVETGRIRDPGLGTLRALAGALGVGLAELAGGG